MDNYLFKVKVSIKVSEEKGKEMGSAKSSVPDRTW